LIDLSENEHHFSLALVGLGVERFGVLLERIGLLHLDCELAAAGDVGGTWRENTYPGCQCDVPSTLYSFSFALNPGWIRTFPLQREIWDYLRQVADGYGVRPHIRFGQEVVSAAWDDAAERWVIGTSTGSLTARVLVLGVGALSEPSIPRIAGIEMFEGTAFHSANWNHDHDLRGERVAVIGTGASAIQFVPRIQPGVAELHVYQRTAPWIMPHPDRPTTRLERWVWRSVPGSQHLWRAAVWSARESLVVGLAMQPRLMSRLEVVARRHLHNQVVDPELRRRLTPDYRLGCKRILVSNEYYPVLRRRGVQLVTAGVREIRPHSVVAADGVERPADTIILGTGFRVTEPPSASYVRGRGGRLLADAWGGSVSAYLGTTIAGFPNAFMITGPNTGLGHSSMVYMIESQVAYIMKALSAMDRRAATVIEVRPEVQRTYNDQLQRKLAGTVWNSGGCKSWYLDASGRNTTLWPSFTFAFRDRTRTFNESDYLIGSNGRDRRRGTGVPRGLADALC
jgi:cation diffusion facilitator CzcD-associated flavoprotein CzcO